MVTKLQPHLSTDNLVYEPSTIRGEEIEKMASTTLFPFTDPKEGFAILVTYEAKVEISINNCNPIFNLIHLKMNDLDQSLLGSPARFWRCFCYCSFLPLSSAIHR